MLLYIQIYVYIGIFWLEFGLILHQYESRMNFTAQSCATKHQVVLLVFTTQEALKRMHENSTYTILWIIQPNVLFSFPPLGCMTEVRRV